MPKYYLLPKRLVDRAPWIHTPVWMLEASVFYLFLGVARVLPFPATVWLFSGVLGYLGYRNQKKRHVVRRNIRFVLPAASEDEREQVVKQIFRSTGVAAAELFLLGRLWRRRHRYIEFSVHPETMRAFKAREAMVFATAHTGAWQLCNLISREYGLPISTIYARETNPWLHRFFLGLRKQFGARMVPSAGGARELVRELAAGHSVGAAFDTRLDQGDMVPFFGVPTPTNTMPGMLSVRGHKLIPIRTVRLPGHRYRVEVLAPLTPSNPEAGKREQVLDLTEQLNGVFERWVRESPGEWLCMKRRWPKDAQPRLGADA